MGNGTVTDAGILAAIEAAGSIKKLAEMVGVQRPSVYDWTHVPVAHVLTIVRETGGKVTRHQLRPDVYPENDAA